MAQDPVAPVVAAALQVDDGRPVVDRRSEPVDGRHGRHDHDVAALEQGSRGVVPEPVDLVVAGRVLLDVRVAARQVRLGLEVVVVADEVLDRVVREELLELLVELRGERLVVRHDERRLLDRLDDLGRGEGLSRAGRPEQDLVLQPALDAVDQVRDRGRLVAGGLIRGMDLEVGHGAPILTGLQPSHPNRPNGLYGPLRAVHTIRLVA